MTIKQLWDKLKAAGTPDEVHTKETTEVPPRDLPALLREAERRVHGNVFANAGITLVSVPADPDHDVDVLLIEAADCIEAMQQHIGELQEELTVTMNQATSDQPLGLDAALEKIAQLEAKLAKWQSACTGRNGSQVPCVKA